MQKLRGNLLAIFAGLLMLGVTSGCLMTGSTAITSDGCLIFGPIFYSSSQDTPETIKNVQSHNSAWYELCRTHE